jgi:membrane-bound inhibitor of C-type lysozyme
MNRIALIASLAASLLFAAAAQAETAPGDKPTTPPTTAKPATPPKADKTAKPDAKTAAKQKRITYACDGGVNLLVTYPPEAQAKARPVKIAMKDTVYFVRPAAGAAGDKYENKRIKLVFQTKGEEVTIEREGKPLAEKCKASAKPGT